MAATAPLHDPFAHLLGYQLRRLSLMVMADLADALQPLELRPAEASVLIAIGANAGITQSELGRMLGIKRANMAPLVAGLEARGVVSRAPVDGRSQALHLTPAGDTLRADAAATTAAHEARCFATLVPADRQALTGRVRQLWIGAEEAE